MSRGRRPKPTAIRRLEGNRGKRAWNHDEPVPPDAHAALPRASRAGGADRVAPGRADAARAWGC